MTHMEDRVRAAFLAHEHDAPDGAGLLDSVHERLSVHRRGSRTVAALVAAFVVVAIVATVAALAGPHRRSEAPATIAPQPTAAPLPNTTSQPTTTTAPSTLPECVRPLLGVYKNVRDFAVLPPLDGPSIDYLESRFAGPSYNSDGVSIRYPTYPDNVVKIDRPDGTVGLRDAYIAAIDDLDGDGRVDFVAQVRESSDDISYIVPGSVAAGTREVAAVGIRLPAAPVTADNFSGAWFPIGDQNGDGAADLMINDRLYSGRQLTDATLGRALDALPAPFRTLKYVVAGVLKLDPAGAPTIVEVVDDGTALVFDDGRPERLNGLDVRNVMAGRLYDSHSVAGFDVDGHRIVQYENGSRSGDNFWRWDLESECAGS